jgi:zinc D-Ala-D-Ala carboxypeptidase
VSSRLASIHGEKVNYFKLAEFECHCGCGRVEMDPAFLDKLDALRAHHGQPLTVSSGYRCPSYNAKVSTTGPTGPHTTGKAADLLVDRGEAYRVLGIALDMGFTGIGIQQKGHTRYLHLDTVPDAPGQPRPTIWSY